MVASQFLEIQAVLLKVRRHVLTRHAIDVHYRKNVLGHCLLQTLHEQGKDLKIGAMQRAMTSD